MKALLAVNKNPLLGPVLTNSVTGHLASCGSLARLAWHLGVPMRNCNVGYYRSYGCDESTVIIRTSSLEKHGFDSSETLNLRIQINLIEV